jgi:hypothetical protein
MELPTSIDHQTNRLQTSVSRSVAASFPTQQTWFCLHEPDAQRKPSSLSGTERVDIEYLDNVQGLQQDVLEQTCSHDLPTRLRPFQRNALHKSCNPFVGHRNSDRKLEMTHCSVLNHQLQALSLPPC